MLKKLLKYDIKHMYKFLIIFYLLIIIFSVTTRIVFSLKQTVVVNVIGQISVGCMFSMMASSLINTLMRSWVRFKETIYNDEAYLTHTLPVTKKEIYESKALVSLINLATTFIVIVLGLFICYYTKDRYILLNSMINNISGNINIKTSIFIISIIFILFLELYTTIQTGFLGIILGHKRSNNKVVWSIISSFVVYSLSQVFVVICLYILGLFNNDILSLFSSNVILNNSIFKIIIIFGIVVYLIINIIVNILSVKVLNKGVNVE